ncbi:MAG: glycoside hydrolase family 16 protein [Bacteroidetes bacterium]|nr:glycoside hydrolase family 16 protein [Bacteroidota bacterium]
MKLLRITLFSLMVYIAACSKKSDSSNQTNNNNNNNNNNSAPVDSNWTFEATPAFQEEFDYTGAPNPNRWNYDIGGSGWGNNELQYYTNSLANASADGNNLNITAIRENVAGMNYSSARLLSKDLGDFLYGRVEVRAKLPAGRGTWPAIWMLPTDQAYGAWPNSGEIDIMEHVGYDPNVVHFSIHTQNYNWTINTQKTVSKNIPTAISDFHKYRVDWTPYAVRAYYDDILVYVFVNDGRGSATWPFDKRFHVMLNLAVGGTWGGAQGVDDTIFPATLAIDYVRVYKMVR